jgi:hypothetical protein
MAARTQDERQALVPTPGLRIYPRTDSTLFSLCSNPGMYDRPASWRMPTQKQMEKLASARQPAPKIDDPAPDGVLPAEYWEAVLRDPRGRKAMASARSTTVVGDPARTAAGRLLPLRARRRNPASRRRESLRRCRIGKNPGPWPSDPDAKDDRWKRSRCAPSRSSASPQCDCR